MKKNLSVTFYTTTILSILFFLISLGYFFFISKPITFQKILSIQYFNEKPSIFLDSSNGTKLSAVEEQLRNIPYKEPSLRSLKLLPLERYITSIQEGNGDCSNFSFGASYSYLKDGKGAAILHFLPKDFSFLKGIGHTVVLIKSTDNKSFVVDYLEGIIPFYEGRLLTYEDLFADTSSLRYFTYKDYNSIERDHNINKYFNGEKINDFFFGVVPEEKIIDYFFFIEKFYIPFGSEVIEKYFYDTLAIFFGYYPSIIVEYDLYQKALDFNKLDTFMAFSAKYSFFIFLFSVLMLLLIKIFTIKSIRIKM